MWNSKLSKALIIAGWLVGGFAFPSVVLGSEVYLASPFCPADNVHARWLAEDIVSEVGHEIGLENASATDVQLLQHNNSCKSLNQALTDAGYGVESGWSISVYYKVLDRYIAVVRQPFNYEHVALVYDLEFNLLQIYV